MSTFDFKRSIPVLGRYDVVVCGGGPAGIGAAVAAAERGAKTLLVERFSFLGGMATAGYVDPMSEFAYNGRRVVGGIPWRFAKELEAAGGAIVEEPRCNVSFDPERYKLVARRMVERAGAECLFGSFVADCVAEGDAVRGIVVAGKGGLRLVEGRYFVDATGDADLAAMAGVPMQPQLRDRQPGTLCFVMTGVDTTTERMHIVHQKNHRFNHQAAFVRDTLLALRAKGVDVPRFGGPWLCTTLAEGCITVNMTRAPFDATDPAATQEAEGKLVEDAFRLADLVREHVPEFRRSRIASLAAVAGVRESRRIVGLHTMTGAEYVRSERYPDSIARACHPVDIHLPGDEGQKLSFPEDAGFIPYRSLVPEKPRNLLVAGRCVSADAEAFAAIRVQAPCMEMGQAAGIAAALCLRGGGIPVQMLAADALVAEVRDAGSFV